jgi:NADPH:quinone reductase-like Zn-dependent oxidoreductase
VAAALDCIGTNEALEVSLALVADRGRMVSIAGTEEHAATAGYHRIGGAKPASKAYRDSVRAQLVDLAGAGKLEVAVVGAYPLEEALAVAEIVGGRHPGGKLALLP